MQGQPEDKAIPKLEKFLPVTAVSLCLTLFTLIPCCLPSTAPEGQERDPGQTVENSSQLWSLKNCSTWKGPRWTNSTCCTSLSCNRNKQGPSWHLGQRDKPTPSQAPQLERVHLQGGKDQGCPTRGHFRKAHDAAQGTPSPPHTAVQEIIPSKWRTDWTYTHIQSLQVKAPGQSPSTVAFSAWKSQHISMQTTVCLKCFSYLSKGTCD